MDWSYSPPGWTERVTSMLPAEKKQQGLNMIPRHEPFEVLYRLNCDNLCADFTEDIEFRFSFGITSLVQRFMGRGKANPFVMKNYTESVRIFTILWRHFWRSSGAVRPLDWKDFKILWQRCNIYSKWVGSLWQSVFFANNRHSAF